MEQSDKALKTAWHEIRVPAPLVRQAGIRIVPLRATSPKHVSPSQLATSADPPPLLRNEPAISEGMSNVKILMTKTKEKVQCSKRAIRGDFQNPKSKIKNPHGPAAQHRTMKQAKIQNISRTTLFPSKSLGFRSKF